MNPRRRRLLIPGLLVVLIVIVVVASLADRAGADPQGTTVSTIGDPRVTEASGMVVSPQHDDLAYVVNDSGSAPVVYAVRISTGQVIGATQVDGVAWRDTEAMAVDADGWLWVADTGDNAQQRTDAVLYRLAEPGPGDHRATAQRYPVSYDDGPQNVEAMVVTGGARYLISKGLTVGDVYRLPSRLSTSETNVARRTGDRLRGVVTDATPWRDGRVLVRTYANVLELDPAQSWGLVRTIVVPQVQQGETIATERGTEAFLIGSEGAQSPLIRVTLADPDPTPSPSSRPGPSPTDRDSRTVPADDGFAWTTAVGGAVGVAVLAALGVWVARR